MPSAPRYKKEKARKIEAAAAAAAAIAESPILDPAPAAKNLKKRKQKVPSSKTMGCKKTKLSLQPLEPELPNLEGIDDILQYNYVTPPQLVLAYTYFFTDMSKYISIGYSLPDISLVIVIHHINRASIVLTANEWLSMFLYNCEIEAAFNKTMLMASKRLSDIAAIEHDVTMDQIIIIKENVLLEINKAEWSDVLQIAEMFTSVINYYTQSINAVKEYYESYIYKCNIQNLFYLDTQFFFTPPNDSKHVFNFTRLFYEIGLSCKKRIN